MPVKIRLARHGRKRTAYYHIVVADSRSPRDGRIIERIGSYNPISNPATIELDFDKALSWLTNGAQPTETAKTILSFKGVLMKKHLLEGVKKGAFTMEEADKKFSLWLDEKAGKVAQKVTNLAKAKADAKAKAFEAEKNANLERENAAKAAEEAAIKAESDAKAAAKAAEAAAAAAEESKPETIDDAVAAAANEGAHTEESEA